MNSAESVAEKIFTFHIQNKLSQAIDELRLQCFPPPSPQTTCKDIYDDKSWHLFLQYQNTIAAYMRLTPGPHGVIAPWTQNEAEVPTGKHVIDFTRFLIHPNFRGLNLFEPFCVAALHFADELGYEFVSGAFKVGRKLTYGGEKVGLLASGNPVYTAEPDGSQFHIQPVVCHLAHHRNKWPGLLSEATARLKLLGYIIDYSTLDRLIDEYRYLTKFSNISSTTASPFFTNDKTILSIHESIEKSFTTKTIKSRL